MKTGRQYLEYLSAEEIIKFKETFLKHAFTEDVPLNNSFPKVDESTFETYLDANFDSFYDFIEMSFPWSHTSEGVDYWESVAVQFGLEDDEAKDVTELYVCKSDSGLTSKVGQGSYFQNVITPFKLMGGAVEMDVEHQLVYVRRKGRGTKNYWELDCYDVMEYHNIKLLGNNIETLGDLIKTVDSFTKEGSLRDELNEFLKSQLNKEYFQRIINIEELLS